ncbi:6-phosphogluconolactonase [Longimicrobium sp.]|uniref:6-phosphogluconolactonase n=1 Tax=Longimicrobium sp. TaxID=2029185 RepID=UPI002B8425DB|nr:6-phosphogluconolactonase [Longimicrobium sp.]HSU13314.1 6-phosphogluconolactonase [Longimicrobium sp.]
MSEARIEVHADAHAAARAGAEAFVAEARAAVEARGRFTVALSGGTAPREMYALYAAEEFASRIPWEGVHLFWGDERCVPPRHPRSNFAVAWEAFIRRVPIPEANVHRILGEMPAEEGAAQYRDELERVFGAGIPRFDVIHLGVGPDAHTCSLFPFSDLLRERERTVAPALLRELGEPRVTFTFPVVNAARRVEMFAVGAGKAGIAWQVLRGPLDPFRLPAQNVRPGDGDYVWIMDEAAAVKL